MPVTISADDLRTIRAIEIAARAADWLRCSDDAFRVPSQTQPGRYYLVTNTSCDCPGFQQNEDGACKHVIAVRLHGELVRAQRYLKRGHLRLLRAE